MGRKPLTFDPARYAHHLEETALSEAEARAFLEALWSIMTAFVDLGFSLKPGEKIGAGYPAGAERGSAELHELPISFDDVLDYICLDTPQTDPISPKFNENNKKEHSP